jgi:hypothetical protein
MTLATGTGCQTWLWDACTFTMTPDRTVSMQKGTGHQKQRAPEPFPDTILPF